MPSLYWVRLGPKTVVSLRGLRAFCGNEEANGGDSSVAARLFIEPGIRFDLTAPQATKVWEAVERVLALEGVAPTLGEPGSAAPAQEGVIRSFRPPYPEGYDRAGVDPGIVGQC